MLSICRLLILFKCLCHEVNGHSYAVDAEDKALAKFTSGQPSNSPSGTFDPTKPCPGFSFNSGPEGNTKAFYECWEKIKDKYDGNIYKLIEEVIVPEPNANEKCGFTEFDDTPRDMGNVIRFGVNGIDSSHHGPCGCQCMDISAGFHLDCAGEFAGKLTPIPIDFGICVSPNVTIWWIAMHSGIFQVYLSCVLINLPGGGGSAGSGGKGGKQIGGGNTPPPPSGSGGDYNDKPIGGDSPPPSPSPPSPLPSPPSPLPSPPSPLPSPPSPLPSPPSPSPSPPTTPDNKDDYKEQPISGGGSGAQCTIRK